MTVYISLYTYSHTNDLQFTHFHCQPSAAAKTMLLLTPLSRIEYVIPV